LAISSSSSSSSTFCFFAAFFAIGVARLREEGALVDAAAPDEHARLEPVLSSTAFFWLETLLGLTFLPDVEEAGAILDTGT
jgi:hypothetical protein